MDCFLWKKSNRGQFNLINRMLMETLGQSKRVCKHFRKGGGVYVYVHGRVSRNTFGTQPWLETELARSLDRNMVLLTLVSPLRQRRVTLTDITGLISILLITLHTSDPTASWLLSFIMMLFVSDLISRDVTLAWNHRRVPIGQWSLPQFGKQEAGGDIIDSIHILSLGKIHRDCCLSVGITITWSACLGGNVKRFFMGPKQDATDIKPHKSVVIIPLTCPILNGLCSRDSLLWLAKPP